MNSPRYMLFWYPAALLCITLGVIAIALSNARQSGSPTARRQCQNNLKNIALAVYNYAIDHDGNWPPAVINDENGKPMHSWRVLVLPYLDAQDIHAQYDFTQPWNSPKNRTLTDAMPDAYGCTANDNDTPVTSFMVINSDGGIFDQDRTTNIDDVYDGTGQTILVAEFQNRSVHWMSPDDATADQFVEDLRGASSAKAVHPGGLNISLSDGRVKFIAADRDEETVRAMITINGHDVLSDEDF